MLRAVCKLFLFSLVIVALLAAGLPAPQFADAQDTGNVVVVDTGRANIRSGPSVYTVDLGSVPGGTELVVTGRNLSATWWRVISPFGEGWISNELVAFRGAIATVPIVTTPAGTPEPPTAFIEGFAVNVYRNPTLDSFIIGIAPTGTSLVISGITADGEWYQVLTSMGVGYVLFEEVAFRGNPNAVPIVVDPGPSFNGPTIQVNADTPVTTAPGGGTVIGILRAGTALPVAARSVDNSYWQVIDAFGIGWIAVGNVSLAGAASNIAVGADARTGGPAYTRQAYATIVIEATRKVAYESASFDADPMWDARYGEQASVIARSLDGLWLEVTKDNFTGWMHFSGITLIGSMASIPAVNTGPAPIINRLIIDTAYQNVRSGPGVQYQSIAVLSGGDSLQVTGKHPDLPWIRVAGAFGEGWVQSDTIIFRGDWAAVPFVTEPAGLLELPTAVIDFPHNVYAQPDGVSVVGSIPGGVYTIIGWNAGYSWAVIDTPIGDYWISSTEFEMRGIAGNAPIVR